MRGNAILRSVDPHDKLVYVWTSFEPDGARRVWACFDQPDLKARARLPGERAHGVDGRSATAPRTSCSTGTTADGCGSSRTPRGSRRTSSWSTPARSTRCASERGGHSLGLYCRQSLRPYLERDAEELFRLTEQGLAFFGEQFAQPFPQERYDQVFVPDFGRRDGELGLRHLDRQRAVARAHRPTPGASCVATVLLHEMAHQWFGDLVTMRWWDDLWLNEAFASFAATWAAVSATEYTDGWAAFLAGEQIGAYQQDQGPASHPVRSAVPDVDHAFATFDAITYYKGQAVLHQLMAFVTEEKFVEGLRGYFPSTPGATRSSRT